jgi:hypothetical protein
LPFLLAKVSQAAVRTTASEIYKNMKAVLPKVVAFGAIFATMERLTKKGFLTHEQDVERRDYGNRSPRLYTITGDGIRALSASMSMTAKMADGLELPEPEPVGM